MKNMIFPLAIGAFALLGTAHAAVSPQEAAKLGTTLTPWGAEVAGNKEGTIPAYAGGLTTPPAGFKAGSGIYVDPFKDEKPLLSINSKNMAEHADKLTEGQKTLLTRYPDFRMDIYPTHRTAAYPQAFLDGSKANATRASLSKDGLGIDGAKDGLPFPIPKNGNEVMWNLLLAYQGQAVDAESANWYVNQGGRRVLSASSNWRADHPYYQPNHPDKDSLVLMFRGSATRPAALAGQVFQIWDPINHSTSKRRAWQYVPGQRRVKVAPELAGDTPHPGSPGLMTMDEDRVFQGALDRYDFKLIGKREIYLPYNLYKLHDSHQNNPVNKAMELVGTAKFMNPDYVRWELHRVWVVEAELKPGRRHLYKRRVFYINEDQPGIAMVDQYDNSGRLFRSGMSLPIQLYDKRVPFSIQSAQYDFSTNTYGVSSLFISPLKVGLDGPSAARPWSATDWAPESMGRGAR